MPPNVTGSWKDLNPVAKIKTSTTRGLLLVPIAVYKIKFLDHTYSFVERFYCSYRVNVKYYKIQFANS